MEERYMEQRSVGVHVWNKFQAEKKERKSCGQAWDSTARTTSTDLCHVLDRFQGETREAKTEPTNASKSKTDEAEHALL
jgi:hypothetical protein